MTGPALVLTYHRVTATRDPFGQTVDPETFAAQMEVLPTLAEVVALRTLDRPSRTRRIAITFDDGYADNAHVAAPILRERKFSATFFVPGRILGDSGEYWWDRLEHLQLDAPPRVDFLELAIRGRPLTVDVRSHDGRLRSLKALNRRLRPLPLAEIEAVLEEVRSLLGADEAGVCGSHALLTGEDLADLAADESFEIGSHAWTHTMLAALSREDQAKEIAASKRALADATRREVTSLAYPYGIDGSFDATTEAIVRDAGYERAFANLAGPFRGSRRFRLPRHMVQAWPAEQFAAQVRRWFDST